MADSIYDYAVAYPFLPDSLDQHAYVFHHIKDARVVFTIPAADNIRDHADTASASSSLMRNMPMFDVRLTRIESGSATFELSLMRKATPTGVPTCSTYTKTVSITDITSAYVPSHLTNDYVLADTTTPTTPPDSNTSETHTFSAVLHPDCYVILQAAPTLTYANRWSIDVDDHAASSTVSAFTSAVAAYNGANMTVTAADSTLTLTCGAGLGTGNVSEIPWVDSSGGAIPIPDGPEGLRSVNGITGDVTVLGNTSVKVGAGSSLPSIEIQQIPEPGE